MSTLRDERSALSRRDLLKGAAFASAALGGSGLFSPAIAEAITAGTHPDLAPPAPARRASMKGVRFNRHEVVRFGIVGTGLRGRSVLSELLAIDNVKIVAVCDVVADKAQKAVKMCTDAGQPAPAVYTGGDHAFEQLVAREDLDFVYTATPWEWHVPVMLAEVLAALAPRDGAIYADEYQTMVEQHRINLVTHDPMLKTHVVVDLGWNDAMSIIMVQRAGSECRIVDYIEESFQTLDWYSGELRRRNYNWGKLWLPHDAVHKDYKTGKSAAEIMTALGWEVEVIPIGDVEHGIRLGRMLFPRLWMDKEKTFRLQECLKRYRRGINATTNQPGGPLHDEYSHGADAFRYLATCVDTMRNDNTKKKNYDKDIRAGNWMSY